MDGSRTQLQHKPGGSGLWAGFWPAAVLLVLGFCFLHWAGFLLVKSDPLPAKADVAVALQGSISAQSGRLDGAMQLLRQNIVARALVSVPKQSYWGESLPPVARKYLETRYGSDLATRVDFCETGTEIDSTEQEAAALQDCIHQHTWKSIVVVTSDYHTRRAGLIWGKSVNGGERVWIHGVADPDFQARGWWRTRRYAKTWFFEFLKLSWQYLFGWKADG